MQFKIFLLVSGCVDPVLIKLFRWYWGLHTIYLNSVVFKKCLWT
jgi:hypothetical protein